MPNQFGGSNQHPAYGWPLAKNEVLIGERCYSIPPAPGRIAYEDLNGFTSSMPIEQAPKKVQRKALRIWRKAKG